MPDSPKILLLDDDQDLLELYREILQRLPEHPEIKTATSAARAIAMLEAEPIDLLVTDIVMPKMDGLQLLTIVRQRWPQLRTVIVNRRAGRSNQAARSRRGRGPVLCQACHQRGGASVCGRNLEPLAGSGR